MVENRSYSLNSGCTSADRDTCKLGIFFLNSSPIFFSWSGIRKENRRQTAQASAFEALTIFIISEIASAESGFITSPFEPTLSAISNRICLSDRGNGLSALRSYIFGLICRPISNKSLNPSVVITATLAPRLWIKALVATVVPCAKRTMSSTSIPLFSSKASSPLIIAKDGSLGVDGVLCKKTRPSLIFIA